MSVALERFPVLHKAEIRTLLNGPESFTPDMQMLLGETPAVRGCFLATGMNSSGIALSAAAGRSRPNGSWTEAPASMRAASTSAGSPGARARPPTPATGRARW